MVSLNVLDDSNFDVIKDIIKGKKVKDIDEALLNNYFVFKTDEGYEIPLELVEVYENKDNNLINGNKKRIDVSLLFNNKWFNKSR